MGPHHLRIGERARVQMNRALAWWIEHRPAAPDLLDEELVLAFERVRETPHAGQLVRGRRTIARRVLLPRTEYFLYYRADESER